MPTSKEFKAQRYAELAKIAKKQGGELKTRTYTILHKPMTAVCRQGHRFTITPKNILRGSWCKKCRPIPRQNEFLKIAKQVAKDNGGRCLSKEYVNARLKLVWQCKRKHQWEAIFDNVANKNSWCPVCSVEGASERKAEWWRKEKRKLGRKRR